MRLVFAGTPEPAVPALQALLDSPHEVAAVVTRPDARSGRGRRTAASPVRELAQQNGIEVLTPQRASDPEFEQQLRDLAPDACPVVAYGALLKAPVLAIPRLGWINLHFSLLPAWRGAAPVQHALLHGDEVTGASTFVLDEGMDTGPVLGTMTETVRPRDTSGDLLQRLAAAGAGLLVATLDALETGQVQPVPQSGEGVSMAPKLNAADGEIDWSAPSFAIDRRVRACTPAPGAWTTVRGERLKITAPVLPAAGDAEALAPGALRVNRNEVLVGTGTQPVALDQVQPPGKRSMAAADWARGARLESQEVLGG
ncbi:methionyl-tRNA formyltransferase [Dermacoccaceae bacterium W4C1]